MQPLSLLGCDLEEASLIEVLVLCCLDNLSFCQLPFHQFDSLSDWNRFALNFKLLPSSQSGLIEQHLTKRWLTKRQVDKMT